MDAITLETDAVTNRLKDRSPPNSYVYPGTLPVILELTSPVTFML